jgi:hypothetical protein
MSLHRDRVSAGLKGCSLEAALPRGNVLDGHPNAKCMSAPHSYLALNTRA